MSSRVTPWSVEAPLESALKQIDVEDRRLRHLQSSLGDGPARDAGSQLIGQGAKAYTFVYLGGVLENLFRLLDREIANDIRSIKLRIAETPPQALSFLAPAIWRGLQGGRVDKFKARTQLLSAVASHLDSLQIVGDDLVSVGIVDGSTVSEAHFECVWLVLGLPGDWFPDLRHKTAIRTIRELRNDIAHWNVNPAEFAARQTFESLLRVVDLVRETIEHLFEALVAWLERSRAVVAGRAEATA